MSPRIALIVRTNREGVARLPRALRAAGLHLTLFARPGTFAASTAHRDALHDSSPARHALLRLPSVLRFLARLDRARPLRVLAGDEDSLVYLARVRRAIARLRIGGLVRHARRAIVLSLPTRTEVGELLARCSVASIAERCGIEVPPWAASGDREAISALCRNHGFPLIVKRDSSSAGMGVCLCTDAAGLEHALADDAGFTGIVQALVEGPPAMEAAVALDGRLLASCGWVKERCYPEPFGPSSVVARIDDPAMRRAAERFAQETGFNGFFSLDFILGSEGPRLIEINPRPTPVCHLGGLASALARALGAEAPPACEDPPVRLAVFPQELRRDPASADDEALVHDIPDDDPPLFRALSDAYFGGVQPRVRRSFAGK